MTLQVIRNEVRSRIIEWKPPSDNMVKLNSDGASKEYNSVGCGVIIRDVRGDWVSGFSKHFGKCNAMMAECSEVFEGFKLTKRLGLRKVEVNVDSKLVVKAIEGGG